MGSVPLLLEDHNVHSAATGSRQNQNLIWCSLGEAHMCETFFFGEWRGDNKRGQHAFLVISSNLFSLACTGGITKLGIKSANPVKEAILSLA